jgi:hypothetical protein
VVLLKPAVPGEIYDVFMVITTKSVQDSHDLHHLSPL